MTTYTVLIHGDEALWEAASPEEQAEVFAQHEKFAQALAERGHTITDGAELMPSTTAKNVGRASDGRVVVTDGPHAETVEQLGGFYVVESDDLDDLLEVCAILAEPGGTTLEVRATVDHSGDGEV